MLSQSVPSSSEGIGQSSSGTPFIPHFLFVSPPPLLIRSMKKIQLALSKRGFSGKISIWAYVHEDYEFLKLLILVSDHFMGDYTYFEVFISNMENRYYYPVLVVPSEQSEESKQSDDQWPGLLMDGAYHLLHVD
ncbi:hypothetical protein F2Q68_00007070 [Brassica cretica]|uniref:Uncharacterized protein n=1 Tax=Brassica cretica TaxID=69181 RepID=A0A8S9KU93_BRACR|nr:hypothetical protein F2Q68_00007070 [Brassica cretica]